MLDGKQRKQALVAKLPREQSVAFQGPGGNFAGHSRGRACPATRRVSSRKCCNKLVEPYRQRSRRSRCLSSRSRADSRSASLAFYSEGDIGNDKVWDCWRLEGPSFVWYFRGSPHVHVWVNVADDPSVKLNA